MAGEAESQGTVGVTLCHQISMSPCNTLCHPMSPHVTLCFSSLGGQLSSHNLCAAVVVTLEPMIGYDSASQEYFITRKIPPVIMRQTYQIFQIISDPSIGKHIYRLL